MREGPRQLESTYSTPKLKPSQARSDSELDDYVNVEGHLSALDDVEDEDERRRRRARIITRCLPLADHIAYRFVGRGEPSDDLIQVARLGLVKTIDRYDHRKGRFLAFAVPTILGELRRYFRDNTWGMRVPRRMKETQRQVRDAIDAMSQRLGRAPTPRELAAELDIELEDVVQGMNTSAYRPLSLDATIPGGESAGQTVGATQGTEDPRFDTIEDLITLSELVSELSAREKVILKMRFGECSTQTEIARALGISQVHVSRLLGTTLDRLRRRFYTDTPGVAAVLMSLPLAG